MKANIHPTYHTKAKISCACGNVLEVGSINEAISIDICAACHPFFTGKQKIVDTARRVERFTDRAAAKAGDVLTAKEKAAKKAARAADKAKKKADRDTSIKTVRV
jgi:large subunit ribosomal protein L31